MIKNVGIIGVGYVGLTTAIGFAEPERNVICYDVDLQKIESLKQGNCPIYEPNMDSAIESCVLKHKWITFADDLETLVNQSDIIFVCVGTPPKEDGSTNLTYVWSIADALREISQKYTGNKIIVIKSTVPIGTTRNFAEKIKHPKAQMKFDVIHNPEFLREGNALWDVRNPDRVIVGLDVNNDALRQKMWAFYRGTDEPNNVFADFNCPTLRFVSPETSELIKYASNAFLANKISFINVLAQLCDAVGANINEVAECVGLDKRIGSHFFNAGIGFGGSCFPKDVSSLVHILKEQNVDPTLFQEILSINHRQVDYVFDKLKSVVGDLNQKTIAVYGLSFKPNTDDTREAPSKRLIEKLVDAGAKVKAHDPQISKQEYLKLFPDIVVIQDDNIYETAEDADAAVLVTEWEIYKSLDPLDLISVMNTPVFFDCRNVLNKTAFEEAGFTFYNIGNATYRG